MAEEGPLDELQRARVDLVRAQIAFAVNRGSDAPPLLLRAAKRLEPLDVALARETYLDAFGAAMFAGRLATGSGLRNVATAARAAPSSPQPPRAPDLLLDGLARRFTDGYAAGAPMLKRALGAFRSKDLSREEGLWLACTTAVDLWDDETWEALADRHLQLVRDAGALALLPIALSTRGAVHMYAGELRAAAALLEEVKAVTEAAGSPLAPHGPLTLAAIRGHEAEAAELIDATVSDVERRGEGIGLAVVHWASSLLYNGLGRYEDALTAAQKANEQAEAQVGSMWAPVELVEAATRTGNPDRAAVALQQLAQMTRASGTNWALGIEARSRALLSESEAAERLYREAIDRLGRTRVRAELARAHLVYGEWLRRERRRLHAREQLRTAHELVTAIGMEAFAERTARELLASGERARNRTVETSDQLTPQETQIARLAGDGLSTMRSAPGSSSAPAPSSTTCTRSSPSSTSARVTSWIPSSSPEPPWPGRAPVSTGPGRPVTSCARTRDPTGVL
jgi:tetratricopeptide (TPR) repeat protein